MFGLIKDLINFSLYWIFLYVCAIFVLILGIVHLKSNEPKTPIIQETHVHEITQVIAAPERKLMEREICNNPSGCEITQEGKCIGCIIEKVWE